MRTWALVPAKRFTRAKSRLAGALDERGRATLARAFLGRALSVLSACELDGILVATDGGDVASFARARRAHVLRDRPGASLPSIIDAGITSVAARGATHVVVLMADLPRIAPEDVRSMVAVLRRADVVAAPDRHGEGTNALGVSTARSYSTSFGGGNNFVRHRTRAHERSLSFAVHHTSALAWDVDHEADLLR